MDPLSLVASIVTIVGVGGEVAKAVRKLASLKGAPDLILALNNEISDLYLVILAIRDIFSRQRASIVPSSNNVTTDNTVLGTLVQANEKVLELRALHQRLTARTTRLGDVDTLNKASWLREHKNVKKMQEDLRTVRLKLSTTLGIIISSSMLHLENRVKALDTKIEDIRTHQQKRQASQDQNLARIESAVDEPIAQLLLSQQRIELKLNADSTSGLVQALESQISATTNPVRNREMNPSNAVCVTAFSPHHRCIDGCVCKCHHLQARRSPRAMEKILGRLFCGYAGLPYLGPPCDNKSCERNTYPIIRIIYFFPAWLLARAFTMVARLSFRNGLGMNIRFPQIVENSSKIFALARHGCIEDMCSLFRQGLASPFDIDGSTGGTALMYAVETGQVEICNTLLRNGADPYHEDLYSRNVYDRAWMTLLHNRFDPETREKLQALFPDQGYVEGLQLNLLHQTVLGLNHLDLASLVRNLPRSAIDDVDSQGRTALFWAARRGDFSKVSLLIRHGADSNIPTLLGHSPLTAAIYSRDEACIRTCLSLVSNINQRERQGWAPLHSACYYGVSSDIIDSIISRGGDIEATVQGSTALVLTAQENYRQCGETLIAHDANLNTIADNGETALLRAINYNAYGMIQLLLQHHADHCLKTPCGETVLHHAARYSDLESLEILCAANLSGLEIGDHAKGYTALEMAERRRGVPSEWMPKFQELIDRVARSNSNVDGDNDAEEVEDFEDALENQI